MVRSLLFCSMPQMQKWASCSHMVGVPLVHKGLFCMSFFSGCALGQWALTSMGHPHFIFSWLTALRNAVSSVIYQVLIYSELIYRWIPYLQCKDVLQDLTGIVCPWHVAAWTMVLLGPPLTFGLDVHAQKVCGNWGGAVLLQPAGGLTRRHCQEWGTGLAVPWRVRNSRLRSKSQCTTCLWARFPLKTFHKHWGLSLEERNARSDKAWAVAVFGLCEVCSVLHPTLHLLCFLFFCGHAIFWERPVNI